MKQQGALRCSTCLTSTRIISLIADINTLYLFKCKRSFLKSLFFIVFTICVQSGMYAQAGAALNFDGSNDDVDVPHNALFNITNSITIEAWVNTSNGTTEQYITAKNNDSWFLAIDGGFGAPGKASFYLNNVAPIGWLYSTTTISDGNWHHIAGTYDGTVMKIYVDGVLENQSIRSGTISTGSNAVEIGSRGGALNWDGAIDEVRIWNGARTQCQIQSFRHAEIPTSAVGLVANYHFNQGIAFGTNTVTSLTDASGNSLNGTLNNMANSGTTSNWITPGGVVSGFTTAVVPTASISVSGNGNNIPQGSSTPTISNFTDFASTGARTFVISNTSGTLNIAAPYFTGPNASEFSLSIAPASSIAASSTSFLVTFASAIAGVRTATLNIPSNDCTNATFSFVITASTTPASALAFDGVNDYIQFADPNLGTSDFTIEQWIKPNLPQNAYLLTTRTSEGSQAGNWFVTSVGANGSVGFELGGSPGISPFTSNTYFSAATPSNVITVGSWNHIAAVRAGNSIRLYVNGVLLVNLNAPLTNTLSTGNNILRFGGAVNFNSAWFNGRLDEVRIWNTARTQCELQTFMNAEIPTTAPGLLANYHFNQGIPSGNNATVTTVIDATGTYPGTLNGFGPLTGSISNWVSPGPLLNGFTTAIAPTANFSLTGNGNNVPMGSSTNTLNNTNFGTTAARTFSIYSAGGGTLNINAIAFSGPNAAQFSVTTLPLTSVTTGTTGFVITLSPTNTGVSTATVNISSNDCTNPTFSFVITASTSPASALSFDGNNDFINVPSNASQTFTSGTIEMMVKINPAATGTRYLLNKEGAFGMLLINNSPAIVDYSIGTIYSLPGSAPTLTNGNWHHIAITFQNGVANGTRYLVDGVPIWTGITTNALTYSNSISIGNRIGNFHYSGEMDNVRVWNYVRSLCEIQTFMNAEITSTASGLVANYHFNQGISSGANSTQTIVTDATGVNNGTLTNMALTGSVSNWVSPGGVANGFTVTSPPTATLTLSGNGNNIPSGSVTSTTNNTNFGTNASRTFSISNSSGTLNIGTIYFTGANASQFSVTALPASSLTVGGTSFVILFTPAVLGTSSAVVNIPSNDCTNPTYSFVIQASGLTASTLKFDGSDDVILTNTNITELGQGDFTIELWLNTTAVSQGLVACTNSNAVWEAGEKSFYLDASGVPVFVGFGNSYIQGNAAVNDGNWHHVAVTWDYTGGLSGIGRIYIDGVNQTQGVSYQAINTNIGTFRLGQANYLASEAPNNFNGTMDEVRIWNRALCLSEINAYRTCEINTQLNGLLANYHFNQGLAFGPNSLVTTLTDATAAPITGTLSSFALNGINSNWVNPGAVTSGSSCAVFLAPEIDITGNSNSIPNNSVLTSTLNFTDFGSVYSRTFSIVNSGTSTLSITTPVTLSGANAGDFSITTQPSTLVAVNGTVNFVLSFVPSTVGTKTAQVNIINSDCNESPYNYVVSGTATAASALNFDGANDYANAGNILTASYTKEAWVKIGASPNGNNFLSNGSGVSGAALWAPGLYNYSLSAGHDGIWNAVQGPTLAFGTWYHVAVTYDQPSQTMVLYLNGSAVSSNTAVPSFSGTNPLHIGAFNGAFSANGSIDEVRIWNRALCASEILNNLNCEILTTGFGLIANYHFNQGIANGNNTLITSITDVSGNNNNAALVNFNSSGVGSNWETPGAVTTGSACPAFVVPEINLVGNGNSILDGDITPSLTDNTSFGAFCFGNNVVRTYSIQNLGNGPLSVSGFTLSGPDALMFAVSPLTPSSPVPSLSTAIFSVTFTPTSAGVKIATLSIGNNDCNESPYDIAISGTCNALPQVTANASASIICNGQTTSVFGTGANSYTWTGGVINNASFNPSITASYSVSGTNALTGCTSTNTAVQTITVNPVPSLSISASSASVCAGGTVVLNPSGANTYTWNPAIQSGVAFVPAATTIYSLNGTSSAVCTSTSSALQTISVLPLPTLSINSGSICSGQSFTLNPQGANTYTYLNGGPIINPITTTAYSVMGSFTATGCQSSVPAISTITVYITPTLSLNSGAICSGDSFTLSAAGANTYTYSSGSPVISPNTTTNYSVNGTSSEGCNNANTAVATVTVHQLPIVTASASQTLICFGSTITLNGGGANSYTWSNGVSDGSAFSPTASSGFTVIGSDINNCKNQSSINVSVNPLPTLTVQSANPLTCSGETTTLNVSGANSYTWSTGAQTSTISVTLTLSANFTLSGTDANLCVNTVTYTQQVDPCAGVVLIDSKLKDVTCENRKDGEIELTPNVSYSQYKVFYFWATPELCADSNCSTLKKLSAGTYPVRARIEYTLSPTYAKIDTIDLSFNLRDLNPPCPITVYNGISLNNDGVNEVFQIENIHSYSNNNVTIFNRWGQKIAGIEAYDNVEKVWPTEKEKEKLLSGTYFYVIDLGDGSELLKGWVEVIMN